MEKLINDQFSKAMSEISNYNLNMSLQLEDAEIEINDKSYFEIENANVSEFESGIIKLFAYLSFNGYITVPEFKGKNKTYNNFKVKVNLLGKITQDIYILAPTDGFNLERGDVDFIFEGDTNSVNFSYVGSIFEFIDADISSEDEIEAVKVALNNKTPEEAFDGHLRAEFIRG